MKLQARLTFQHPEIDGVHKEGMVYEYDNAPIIEKLLFSGYFSLVIEDKRANVELEKTTPKITRKNAKNRSV